MNWHPKKSIFQINSGKLTAVLLVGVIAGLWLVAATDVYGQKKFTKKYPAGKNVRVTITNRTGTITVQGWERNEVRIVAYLERPTANISPQNDSGSIEINVVRDNQGRNDVGDANFTINVPFSSEVDIETRIGNLSVTNIQGALVRAHITSEGDVTLNNISAKFVSAKNLIGNIFYDGVIKPNGTYRFASTRGTINLRIPLESSFRLVATAPSTRNIALGSFYGAGLRFMGTGRRVTGKVGDGKASITVTNQRGTISFINR